MSTDRQPTSDDAPFGTRPRRGSAPLALFALLYVGWLGVLLWMAAFQPGG